MLKPHWKIIKFNDVGGEIGNISSTNTNCALMSFTLKRSEHYQTVEPWEEAPMKPETELFVRTFQSPEDAMQRNILLLRIYF